MSPRFSLRLLSGQSDARLLALARAGHERAFEALVQRYRRPLLRFCRRTMRLSDARAEDAVQLALLKAWMALAAGTEVRDFRPWLYSIVRNTALNAMRGHGDSDVALSESHANAGADSEIERRLEMRDALAYVAALPQAQREAIFLTVIDGQSHEQVASMLGITNGAVRGLLHRARTTLRRAAAAIIPQPLIAWAAGSAGSAGPSAERIAEVSSGAGVLGAGGLLAKGAALAVTAGALATGAAVQLGHSPAPHTRASAASVPASQAAQSATVTARAGLTAASSPATTQAGAPGTVRGASPAADDSQGQPHAPASPQHAAGNAAPRAVERGSRDSGESGSDSGPSGPSDNAPVASTATTPAEEAPEQTQPQAPPAPAAEQPKGDEGPTTPGGGGTDDSAATTSCTTTEPSKPCDR